MWFHVFLIGDWILSNTTSVPLSVFFFRNVSRVMYNVVNTMCFVTVWSLPQSILLSSSSEIFLRQSTHNILLILKKSGHSIPSHKRHPPCFFCSFQTQSCGEVPLLFLRSHRLFGRTPYPLLPSSPPTIVLEVLDLSTDRPPPLSPL